LDRRCIESAQRWRNWSGSSGVASETKDENPKKRAGSFRSMQVATHHLEIRAVEVHRSHKNADGMGPSDQHQWTAKSITKAITSN
jgi:hypothetical protein